MGFQTIAAIATPIGSGGIGMIRVSGDRAIEIADAVFKAKRDRKLADMPGYTAAYGHVYAGDQLLDECVALVFRGPKSYTGEDVVELSCHGGTYVMRKILDAVVSAGAKLAEAGEFTKRAFLNGRIDLTQAEAVMELIAAKGEQAAAAAIAQQEGAFYQRIEAVKATLYDISSDICAFVDFPEEDIPDLSAPVLHAKLETIDLALQKCLDTYQKGRMIREGIETVIVGKPNVGKSTLMNRIAGYDKSIVTEIPGTTRDLVEECVNFGGSMLNLTDTAGLREAQDVVEKIGVTRAKKKLESAELIYAVFDASRALEEEDEAILDTVKDKRVIAILNKCDLPQKINKEYIKNNIKHTVELSALNESGLTELEKITEALFLNDKIDTGNGMIANERQLICVRRAKDGMDSAIAALSDGITLDAISTGIEQAVSALSELTGERASEEIIGQVFEKFCVGK